MDLQFFAVKLPSITGEIMVRPSCQERIESREKRVYNIFRTIMKRRRQAMELICLGDSLTYGYGVRRAQVWTALAEQRSGWKR